MLLKHLYDYAHSRNLLEDPAFSRKAVRWIIDLDTAGNLLGQGPVDTAEDGKRGKEFFCPKTTKSKQAGGVAEFLVDGITAVFGLEGDWKTVEKKGTNANWQVARNNNNAEKKNDFWRQMEACAESCVVIAACQKYINQITDCGPSFLRRDGNAWKITSAAGIESTLGSENFSFRVNGELLLENKEVLDWWRAQHSAEVKSKKGDASTGLCIVSEKLDQPIALTHGVKIMSVPGGQPSGSALVSFYESAFASYGLNGGENCPTSVDAAHAYCIALNHLVQSDDSSLRIGGTVLCFWAKETKAAGSLFASLLNKPDQQSVATFMKAPWAGIERELTKQDSFIAATLKGCGGRVAVSHWLQEPLEQAIENFKKWFVDLEIITPPKQIMTQDEISAPLSINRLLGTMAPLKRDKGTIKPDFEKLRAETISQLYRAALEGISPPTSLITPLIRQLYSKLVSDKNYNLVYDESRFALLKLIINRNRKDLDMEIRPQLTTDTADPAYNCGRLLSVLSETQKKAQNYPKGFTGVAERYFGAASTSPATVLPLLLRLNRHHLDKIRKASGSAYEEVVIREIVAKFQSGDESQPPAFPRHLDLQAQGRFAIGFYQQQAEDFRLRCALKVENYLKERNPEDLNELTRLRMNSKQDYYERVSQHYGSEDFKTWEKCRKKENEAEAATRQELDLFNFANNSSNN